MSDNPARIVLKGKKSTITIDADSGGIWIDPVDARWGLVLIGGGDDGKIYVGGYTKEQYGKGELCCDFALSAGADGVAHLQGRAPTGQIKSIPVHQLADLLTPDTQPAAPPLEGTQT